MENGGTGRGDGNITAADVEVAGSAAAGGLLSAADVDISGALSLQNLSVGGALSALSAAFQSLTAQGSALRGTTGIDEIRTALIKNPKGQRILLQWASGNLTAGNLLARLNLASLNRPHVQDSAGTHEVAYLDDLLGNILFQFSVYSIGEDEARLPPVNPDRPPGLNEKAIVKSWNGTPAYTAWDGGTWAYSAPLAKPDDYAWEWVVKNYRGYEYQDYSTVFLIYSHDEDWSVIDLPLKLYRPFAEQNVIDNNAKEWIRFANNFISDIPAVKLRCDDGSQLPTEISLNHVIKQTILDAITDIDIELSTDLTEERNEKLTLKLTFKQLNPDNTEVSPRRFKEAQIHLQSLITHWGEIEGGLLDQTDLQEELDKKANIVFNFTKPDGATVDLDMPEVPPLIDEKVNLHDADETAHPFILDKIEQDIAAHDADETAYPFLLQETAEAKQQITDDIATHNADASSHTTLRQDLQQEFEIHLAAHNAGAQSHQNIQTSWNQRLEDHNQDPLEDQHPLIRSQIAAIQTAMLPDPRTLPNGNYLINVAGGVATRYQRRKEKKKICTKNL
jgi:hypothetical protein